jgi:hypothetical protein
LSADALAHARELVRREPLSEEAARELMTLLAAAGDPPGRSRRNSESSPAATQ